MEDRHELPLDAVAEPGSFAPVDGLGTICGAADMRETLTSPPDWCAQASVRAWSLSSKPITRIVVVSTFSSVCGGSGSLQTTVPGGGANAPFRVSTWTSPSGARRTK